MRITNIEKGKGRRYKVYVDGLYWASLDPEVIVDSSLKEDLECSEEFLEEIKYRADVRRAKERALYLLEYRDHSRKELIDKLKKDVDEEIAASTADKMEEFGFLDDGRYAEKLARDLLTRKRLGRRRAFYELQRKGIERELAERVLDEAEVDPADQLGELIAKKYARYLGDEKGRKKVISALFRLGHSYEDVKRALQQYEEFEENEQWL